MEGDGYSIGKLNGKFVLVYRNAQGQRHRHSLGTDDASQAKLRAPALYAELTRPKGRTIRELWDAYIVDKAGNAKIPVMKFTGRALEARFFGMAAETITDADCKAHISARRADNIKDWTIYTELTHLRSVLLWAVKQKLIEHAPHIERPPEPKPKEDKHLSHEEVQRLTDACNIHHVKLAVVLFYVTGARSAALRGLTWDRVDFVHEKIDLRDPTIKRPHKGRAIVPMNQTAKEHLLRAQRLSLSKYVIEWAGRPVRSNKTGLKYAAKAAGITQPVSPHVLRHSSAVRMAEQGVDMEEIRQYLGHRDVKVTSLIYARFSPKHLQKAASALEL